MYINELSQTIKADINAINSVMNKAKDRIEKNKEICYTQKLDNLIKALPIGFNTQVSWLSNQWELKCIRVSLNSLSQ